VSEVKWTREKSPTGYCVPWTLVLGNLPPDAGESLEKLPVSPYSNLNTMNRNLESIATGFSADPICRKEAEIMSSFSTIYDTPPYDYSSEPVASHLILNPYGYGSSPFRASQEDVRNLIPEIKPFDALRFNSNSPYRSRIMPMSELNLPPRKIPVTPKGVNSGRIRKVTVSAASAFYGHKRRNGMPLLIFEGKKPAVPYIPYSPTYNKAMLSGNRNHAVQFTCSSPVPTPVSTHPNANGQLLSNSTLKPTMHEAEQIVLTDVVRVNSARHFAAAAEEHILVRNVSQK
jgi:hypothetical protein